MRRGTSLPPVGKVRTLSDHRVGLSITTIIFWMSFNVWPCQNIFSYKPRIVARVEADNYRFIYAGEGQSSQASVRISRLSAFGDCKRRLDYFEEIRGIEGLVQNIDCAFLDGFLPNVRVMVGRYQNHRQSRTFEFDAAL